MTKSLFESFRNKDSAFLKKAKLLYFSYILIFVILLLGMFMYQIHSFFVTFIIIIFVMLVLFQFVFKDYIVFTRKYTEYKRILLHRQFSVSDEVIDYFSKDVFQKLYDDDFELVLKNDVYVLASKPLEDSIYKVGLAVFFSDDITVAVNSTPKELSNELSGYILQATIIKVILLVAKEFSEEDKEVLKYESALHKNTVIIGLEKSTKQLYYNYFLNGHELDLFLGELFKIDLTLVDEYIPPVDEEDDLLDDNLGELIEEIIEVEEMEK